MMLPWINFGVPKNCKYEVVLKTRNVCFLFTERGVTSCSGKISGDLSRYTPTP